MNKLTILDWDKPKREVDFIGYGAPVCYIYNEAHERRAIDLWPTVGFNLKLTTPPDEIRRTILHLPSFNLAPPELVEVYSLLKGQDASAPAHEPLLLATVHHRKKWDGPNLTKKLQKGLNEELLRLRHEYEVAKQEIAKRPADEQEQARRELEYRFSFNRQDLGPVSMFKATVDDVKDGLFGLQEKLLQKEFIKYYAFDPRNIEVERARFYQTIRLDKNVMPDSTRERLAKRVRYKVHLTDNTDSWLEGIHERPLLTPQEIEEFEKLEAATEIPGDERLSRDTVRRLLTVEQKGESKPMTPQGLKKLCSKAHVPYKFPMLGSVVRKLKEHRQRRRQCHNEQFEKHRRKPNA